MQRCCRSSGLALRVTHRPDLLLVSLRQTLVVLSIVRELLCVGLVTLKVEKSICLTGIFQCLMGGEDRGMEWKVRQRSWLILCSDVKGKCYLLYILAVTCFWHVVAPCCMLFAKLTHG